MSHRKLCFLDMDDVMADFVGGMVKAHGRPDPYRDGQNAGVHDMEKAWGISLEDFWRPALHDGFWSGLGRTAEADCVVSLAYELFGRENVAALTAPNKDWRCVPGKYEWMRLNYWELKRSIIFAKEKHFLAGPGRVLIDDKDENVDAFNRAGGTGILMPRPWNRSHELAHMSWEIVEMRLRAAV